MNMFAMGECTASVLFLFCLSFTLAKGEIQYNLSIMIKGI